MRAGLNRRDFARLSVGACSSLCLPGAAFAALEAKPKAVKKVIKPSRSIMLHSIHTGESGEFKYLIDGEWVVPELQRLFHLLRDHRSGDVHPMDGELLEQLFLLQRKHGKDTPFDVISGYRSPKTNAKLAARNGGVAKKSLHMQGKAIDIALPGVPLAELHASARALEAGGVGKYTRSGFIHLDTGRVRFWGS